MTEKEKKFIELWATLGTSWGINKTMSQIFALLLINENPLSVSEIMERLNISRGNVSMNIRSLLEWRLISKKSVEGERKEFYYADKDIENLAKIVLEERKRREIDPLIKELLNLQSLKSKEDTDTTVNDIIDNIIEASSLLDRIMNFISTSKNNSLREAVIKRLLR